jgi:hypothetical protein
MEIILVSLALIAIIVFVVPLAVLRAGIRRQERAHSLACRPSGVSAALTRCLVGGLYVRQPITGADQATGESPLVPDDNELSVRR